MRRPLRTRAPYAATVLSMSDKEAVEIAQPRETHSDSSTRCYGRRTQRTASPSHRAPPCTTDCRPQQSCGTGPTAVKSAPAEPVRADLDPQLSAHAPHPIRDRGRDDAPAFVPGGSGTPTRGAPSPRRPAPRVRPGERAAWPGHRPCRRPSSTRRRRSRFSAWPRSPHNASPGAWRPARPGPPAAALSGRDGQPAGVLVLEGHTLHVALQRQRALQARQRLVVGAAWEDHDLVFANAVGGLSIPRTCAACSVGLRSELGSVGGIPMSYGTPRARS